ncbi:neprilysin-2-like [Haemaphysalis longicornis]
MKSPPLPTHRHEFHPTHARSLPASLEEPLAAPCPLSHASLVALVSGIVLVAVVVVVLYFSARSSGDAPQLFHLTDESCGLSDACLKYGKLLAATLDRKVDPCDDFTAFVTSRWASPKEQRLEEGWKLQWNLKYAFINTLMNELRSAGSSSAYPLMRVAEAFFTSCKGDTTRNPVETHKFFKELLRNINIPWPERPPSGVDPLDAFLNLCIRFQVALWFDIKMAPGKSVKGRKAVYITPSAQHKYLNVKYKKMMRKDDFTVTKYIDNLLKYFPYQGDANKSKDIVDFYKVFNITKDFALRLDSVTEDKASVLVRLGEIGRDMNVATDRIIAPLNKYFHPVDRFGVDDFAVMKGKGIINAVRDLLKDHDPTDVLSHLGWWMIEVYSPIVYRDLFELKYGDRNYGHKVGSLFCTTQVESGFKIMLLANHVRLNFPPEIKADVNRLLDAVREAAIALYEESKLPASNKAHITQKIRAVRVNIWPDKQYQSEKRIRQIYAHVNTNQDSTLGYWYTTRLASALLIGTDAYFEEKRLPRSFADAAFSYDDVLNSVTMSMLAAHEPLFYPDHILLAASYGGIGTQFAKQLLLGVDTETVLNDTHLDSYGADRNYENASSPEISSKLGANITHWLAALRAFKAQNVTSLKLGGFSNHRLFFISFCHTQTRLSTDFDCNQELQGAAAFVDAFSCKKGSRMNPQP